MSSTATAPNYLAEAIGIADRTLDIPVHEGHLRALLGEIPLAHARRFTNGERRCSGCAEWMAAKKVPQCEKCPDSFCAECKADHAVYCK